MIATLDMVNDEGDIKWDIINFPDKHKHIDLSNNKAVLELATVVHIIMRVQDGNDLFMLKQAVNAIRNIKPAIRFFLTVPYLIASRYDRKMYECDSEDLKIICEDINSLGFEKVLVIEPHSMVTGALINNFTAHSPMEEKLRDYIETLDNQENLVIFAPDLGAVKRTEQFLVNSQLAIPMGILNKNRDLKSGKILGMRVMESPSLEGKTVILYDDLCDGGKTFTSASALLRAKGVSKVILVVTHGIFSKGYDALFNDELGKIDYIITTDTYQKQLEHPNVKIVNFV